jgi:lysophospholipase L1-like esterase
MGMRSQNRWVANVTLLAISSLLSLVLAEGILRLAWPDPYDVHPRGLYSADARVGYAPTAGFEGIFERGEYRHAVSIGRSGLRGSDPRPRQPETFRIVCLGDSFTWGLGVGDDEAYPQLLERRLAERFPGVDVQVLNAGVPGYGTVDELRYFESRIALLDPDFVTVQFLAENDFNDNRQPALGRVDIRDGWLHAAEPPRRGLARLLDGVKQRSLLARLVSERGGYLAARLGLAAATQGGRFSEADAGRAAESLRRMAGLARSSGAETLFVFATSQAPVVSRQPVATAASAVVADAAAEASAGFLDLTPALRAREDRLELYYPLDGHWTVLGHAAAAEILAEWIAAEHGDEIAARARRAGVSALKT